MTEHTLTERVLHALTDEQREAVRRPADANTLVIAGAGTGKTRTLIARIAWLAANGVPLSRVLVTTFTNRAAREIKSRLATLLEVDAVPDDEPITGTYHSIAARILRRHHEAVSEILHLDPPLTGEYTILDADDAKTLVRQVAGPGPEEDPKLRLSAEDAEHLLEARERHARRHPDLELLLEDFDRQEVVVTLRTAGQDPRTLDRKASDVLRRYERRKMRDNTMDYTDLIVRAVRVLEAEPGLGPKLDCVLADEYQDTDPCQERFLTALGRNAQGPDASLFAVGDPNQLIYAWRGAEIANILHLPERIGAGERHLKSNWRSAQNILDLAALALERNHLRRNIALTAAGAARAHPIVAHEWASAADEANFHAARIADAIAAGTPAQEIAVLGRTARVLTLTDAALAKARIPYRVVAGRRFASRGEIRDVAAWIRVLLNPDDATAAERCLMRERKGLGQRSMERILDEAQAERRPPLECAADLAERGALPTRAREHATRIHQIARHLAWCLDSRMPMTSMIGEIIEQTGIGTDARAGLQSRDPDEREAAQRCVERLDDLRTLATDAGDLRTLAEQLVLADNTSLSPSEPSVTLSTIHQAKGLEWTDVAVVGLEEGIFPSGFSDTYVAKGAHDARLEEERRCLHVAITRAKEQLTVTWSRLRHGEEQTPSPFVREIEPGLTIRRHDLPNTAWHDATDAPAHRAAPDPLQSTRPPAPAPDPTPWTPPPPTDS